MKKYRSKIIIIALIAMPAFLLPSFHPADAAVTNWQQKGFSIMPRWDTDFSSDTFKQSVLNLSSINANYVSLILPWYQSNIYSTDIGRGWNTPTDQSVVDAIKYIHSLGMKVNLKPHIESYDGRWRAEINPGDRSAWFTAYGNILKNYAAIAKNNGVEELTVGTELINMSSDDANPTNTQNWSNLIDQVRGIYSGTLTYSSNWGAPGWTDEKNRIAFWYKLDVAGISAYYPLNTNDTSVQGFKNAWDQINNSDITPFEQKIGKQVAFVELGYRSLSGTHWAPFDFASGGNPDQGEQANLYEALFEYWDTKSFMTGVQLWDWSSDPNAGGPGDTNFTPQNKQAEAIIKKWFSGQGSGGNNNQNPPPPASGGTFNTTVSTNPSQASQGQNVTVSVNVTNNDGNVGGDIVDVEIFNSSGQRSIQQFYDNQSFNSNETKKYSFNWTAGGSDTYTVKIGIFNSNWTSNYYWNGSATTITIGSNTPPPPPPPSNSTINVWWPANGSGVSGTQPFKAMVPGLDISNYTMFWQVDGDRLNQMNDSYTDYPHKESNVDVSGWHWNGSGPYALNFVAKNNNGSTIAQNQININVF